MYSIKEMLYTLQGEGAQAGRASVFCRFSGCNLWNGREEDRETADCYFCDTDFVGTDGEGGGKFPYAEELASAIERRWIESVGELREAPRFVVFTGGEPLLQLDDALIRECKLREFEIAVETNGTITAPSGIDWLTVSPKPNSTLLQTSGDELKLVYPHEIEPDSVKDFDFTYFFLSPMTVADPDRCSEYRKKALEYCRMNPQWRLTLQYHKFLGIP